MKIEIEFDNSIEPKIVIHTKEMTDEIKQVIEKLSVNKKEIFTVYKEDETYLLNEDDIESIYTENGKVFVKTKEGTYQSKNRLYEYETILSTEKFIRISNSEIVNFDKVKNLNTKLLGTICINFKSGYQTYVSRRYIKKIKEFLNI